jgi:hypothetical protein
MWTGCSPPASSSRDVDTPALDPADVRDDATKIRVLDPVPVY